MRPATSMSCSTTPVASIGEDWGRHLVRDLQPIMLPNDRAVGLGLVLTELVINANKYAYGGASGPLRVTLAEDRNLFRLIVTDEGADAARPAAASAAG